MTALRLRVRLCRFSEGIDLPLLTSIHLGWNALTFDAESVESTLVMKSASCEKAAKE